MSRVVLSTTEFVYGKKIIKHLGLVRGTTIRARHIGHDILAKLRGIIGGEIHEYTKLMAESREQVLERMMDDARDLGGNAIVGVRFSTSHIAHGAAELVVYGTAVLVEDADDLIDDRPPLTPEF
ncbi:YbjQ family protein [Aliikangiella sp. G2MR2-5]|uniref:YbjQ family protein n=1 Tax=Aliikangiella sp. G2MR2-5 TaxID=2788943 RepID=UPI0018AC0494|nr:YbjQ family protein [Aliikangiella sp. G2MR2-5]